MDYKKHNYLVKIFKAMSNSNRLKIIDAVVNSKSGTLTVTQIVEKTDLGQALVSQHLNSLRRDGILQAKQDSLHMYYALKDQNILKFLKC